MNAPDADGWAIEVSEGTPTQAVIGGVDDSPSRPVARGVDVPTEGTADPADRDADSGADPASRRARDENGRFVEGGDAEGSETPSETPVEDKQPSKRSPEGRKLTLRQEIDQAVKERETIRREIAAEQARLAGMRQPAPQAQPQGRESDDPGDYAAWAEKQTAAGSDDSWERHQRLVMRYEAQEILKAERDQQQQRQRFESEVVRRKDLANQGRTVYNDWDAVFASVKDVPMSPALEQALLAHPDGHRLAYEIAKDPASHADVLNAGTHYDLGVALGTLTARLTGANAAPPARSMANPLPAPIKPLGSSPTQSSVSLDEKPFERWTAEDVRKANKADRMTGRL